MQDEIVLITGASAGIGEAAARKFLQAGARVILVARRAERLQALAADFADRALALPVDVTDRAAVEEALKSLPAEFRAVTILINNAGAAFGMAPAQESELDDWEAMVDLNIKGVLYITHPILQGMVERNRGHILNLGSVAGTYPYRGGHVYSASKAFLEQFSLTLRTDLIGKRIRVTNIEPGMVETEFSVVRFKGDEQKARDLYANFERLTGEDIAEILYFAAALPAHVNLNRVEVMPTMQAFAGFALHRES